MPNEVWIGLIVTIAVNATAIGIGFGSVKARLSAVEKTLQRQEGKMDKHNNFIERMYACEGRLNLHDSQISELKKEE
jgi:hypothetical protein